MKNTSILGICLSIGITVAMIAFVMTQTHSVSTESTIKQNPEKIWMFKRHVLCRDAWFEKNITASDYYKGSIAVFDSKVTFPSADPKVVEKNCKDNPKSLQCALAKDTTFVTIPEAWCGLDGQNILHLLVSESDVKKTEELGYRVSSRNSTVVYITDLK